jgi:hypothetical protein
MKRRFAILALSALCQLALDDSGAYAAEDAADDSELIIAPRQDQAAQGRADLTAFRSRLFSGDFAKVQAAARELAATKDPKAPPLLWDLFNAGDAQRRLLAVRSIGQLGAPNQEENLVRVALGERFQSIRLAAAEELARLDGAENAVARLARTAAEENAVAPLFRMRALQAIAQVKGRTAAASLARWLAGTETGMAEAAAEGMARLGDASQASALVAALRTASPELKPALADALRRLTGRDFRFDLVQWEQWLKDRPAGPASTAAPAPLSGADPAPASPPPAPEPGWDVVVVFDTTGSLTRVWPEVYAALDPVLAALVKQSSSLRLGAVRYRAPTPERALRYVVQPLPLTRDHAAVREDVKNASFGGDSGALHIGLDCAIRQMPWRVEARKMIVLVGDTAPAAPGLSTTAQLIAEAWQFDHILINVVYIRSSHGEEQRPAYCALGQIASGRFYEYNRAEKCLLDAALPKAGRPQAEPPAETAAKWCTAR